jgi:3-methyladenine DNA glycosylase Tag
MTPFRKIFERAAARKGGVEALEAMLEAGKPAAELAAIPDSRWLAQMTKRIFQAGFVWTVIEDKWPAFEEAFEGFEPRPLSIWSDEQLDAAARHPGVVANMPKIMTVRDNAQFLVDLADEHGSAAKCLAEWPASDQIGLMALMKQRGKRLGGNTGTYVLRFMGRPTFILSDPVVKALIHDGVVDKAPTSGKALAAVQAAFNAWAAESGRDLTQISRVLALSVD